MKKSSNIRKIAIAATIIIGVIALIAMNFNNNKNNFIITPEIARSMTYGTAQKNDKNTESEYVTFDSFFLKDLNGDGVADAIRGTCNEVGKQDTLYFELRVLNNGYFKDGVITIEGDNFYLNTAVVKDQMVKENYIGTNTRRIEFKDIQNGSQKLFAGIVRSGDYSSSNSKTAAIGNDTTKYSRNGRVILTGTHVADDKTETPIRKEVPITVDWYGKTVAQISKTNIKNEVNSYRDLYDENNLNLSFKISPAETANQLILKKNNLKGTIPALNGYMPTEVTITGNNIHYTYNVETGEFEAWKDASINENGIVTSNAYDYQNYYSRYNEYNFNVTYPVEAYLNEKNYSIQIVIPLETYYEGYNNPNEEFDNPYVSNVAKTSVAVVWKLKPQGYIYNFDVTIGKYVYNPYERYVISKEKPLRLYNQISEEEKEDYYEVRWYAYTGPQGNLAGLIMKENKHDEHNKIDNFIKSDASRDSMDGIEKNVGVYFSGASDMLGKQGWIKIYNDDSGDLVATFDSSTWNKYTSENPYMYEKPVKRIRVETSTTQVNSTLTVYNVKELDDNSILDTYYLEEFDNLNYITTNLTGYYGTLSPITKEAIAHYEAPYSIARVSVSPNAISTQEQQEHEQIRITTQSTNFNEQKWKDGSFVLKLPKDILNVEINSITSSDLQVKVQAYDVYEEDGNYYIRIFTENEVESIYTITVDCNITPDPRIPTTSEPVELYAKNENAVSYYLAENDVYDVDANANTAEKVNKDTTSIGLVSPDSLLTNQTGKEFDNKESVVVAPQVALVEKDERDAKIEVNLTNNYANEITDVFVQGVIPFEGNKFVLGNRDLGSTFTTTMKSEGITVPEDIASYVTVYYSENERPTNDVNLEANGWKTKNQVTDWSKIKTYAISLGEYRLKRGESKTFSYEINLPEGTDYNKVTYSEHAVYFALMTENGKYETSTATSKLGFLIAKKYDLQITKYQAGTPKLLQGVTFTIKEDGVEDESTSIRVTNNNGILTLKGLYAEKIYRIKEVKTTEDYILNGEEILLYTYVDENDNIHTTFKNENGTYTNLEEKYSWVKSANAIKEEGQDYKVNIELENEVKAKFKLTKKSGETLLKNVKFKLTGRDKDEVTFITNKNGEISTSGLRINETYTLEEVRAVGYYLLENPITFKIVPNGENFTLEANGNGLDVSNSNITVNDYIPTINLIVGDEKIPTYSLKVTKYAKAKEGVEEIKLQGAQFQINGDGLPERGFFLSTDENGEINLSGLYEYVEESGRAKGNITGEYTLKEINAPAGYSLGNIEIKFKAQRNNSGELEVQVISGEDNIRVHEGNTDIKVTNANQDNAVVEIGIENAPIFVLTKKDENGAPLAGVEFEIYVEENENTYIPAKDVRGNYIGEERQGKYISTTNLAGEISLDLPNGIYKAVEVGAPEKYALPENEEDRTQYFGIGISKPGESEIGAVEWGKAVAGTEWDSIYSSYATTDGGAIAVGSFYREADLNADGIADVTSVGYLDGLVIKYDQAGNIQWSKSIGGIGDDEFTKVIQTKDGGYAIVGYISSDSINVDSNVRISGVQDGILIKLNAQGDYEWSRTIGGIATDTIYSVTEDASKNLIVAGSYKSPTLNFGGTTTTLANSGSMNGFIASYTKDGEFNWANRAYSSSGSNGLNDVNFVDVKTLADGTIVGAVNFIGSVTLNTSVSSRGLEDSAIVLINSETGGFTKNIRIGGSKNVKIKGITPLAEGSFMAYGEFNGTIDVTGGTSTHYTSKGDNFDTFIIKYTKEGVYQAEGSIAYGSKNSDDEISEVVQTQDKGLLVAGFYYSTNAWDIDSDGTNDILKNANTPTNAYDQTTDSYILKLSKDMKVDNVYRQFGPEYEVAYTVAQMKNGGFIVGGTSESEVLNIEDSTTVDNIGFTVNKSEQLDGFLVKYNEIVGPGIDKKETIEFTNKLKEFKITTELFYYDGTVEPYSLDGLDETKKHYDVGGIATGEYGTFNGKEYAQEEHKKYVETVAYGKNGEKVIQITPDSGYSITRITINGESYLFTPDSTGKVEIPIFEDVREDKHIVIVLNLNASSIIVNHWLWTEAEGITTTKVAESEYYAGKIGTDYTTEPHTDLIYEIITNKDYYGELTEAEVQTRTGKTLEELGYTEITNENDKNYGKTPLEQFLNDYYIPSNATGKYTAEQQIVDYYYKEKEYKLTVYHLIEGTDTPVPDINGEDVPVEETLHFKKNDPYTTTNSNKVDYTKWELVTVPENAEGTIIEDTVVKYYYRIKDAAQVIVHHYIVGTETKVPSNVGGQVVEDEYLPTEGTKKVGDEYTTSNAEGKLAPNYRVATNKDVYGEITEAEVQTKTGKTLEEHGFTEITDTEDPNYGKTPLEQFLSAKYVPANANGTYKSEVQEVIYYYIKDNSNVTNVIEKTVDKTLVKEGDELELTYTINYRAQIKDYIGDASVTIKDMLPFEIDTSKNYNLNGGTYDASEKTITWKHLIKDINTYENEASGNIAFTKIISLTYKDMPENTLSILNKVEGSVLLLSTNEESDKVTSNAITTYEHKKNIRVTKEWDDNNNENQKRPASINFVLSKLNGVAREVIDRHTLNVANGETTYTFENLPKYDNAGNTITYTVSEEEVSAGDLKYYDEPQVGDATVANGGTTNDETANAGTTNSAITTEEIIIKNKFKTLITQETSQITKTGTEIIHKETDKVNYSINYKATVKDYYGNATLQIIDELPYHIDEAQSDLKEGVYSAENKTITWDFDLGTIDTIANGDFKVEKNLIIDVVFTDIDVSKENFVNNVKGKLTLKKGVDEVKDDHTTRIDCKTRITVTKEWEDNNNENEKRPAQIKFEVYNGDNTKVAEHVLNTDTETSYTFELEKYDENDRLVTYTVKEVEVNAGDLKYYDAPQIRNGTSENEVIVKNKYKTLTTDETSEITKTGTDIICRPTDKVNYVINYKATVKDYLGNATLEIVDELPYHIDETQSDLKDGVYSEDKKTITWNFDLGEIDTIANGNYEVEKNFIIDVVFTDIDMDKENMVNNVKGKLTLKNKVDEVQDDHTTVIDTRAKVIVHHYIENTIIQLAPDEKIPGKPGEDYSTQKSPLVPKNYEVVSETPEKYKGQMEEEVIHVIYYYNLKQETVTNDIEKTAKASKEVEVTNEETGAKEIHQVLTKEDGIVLYAIKYNYTIKGYIGKAKVTVVDTLPAKINLELSNLLDGTYNAETNTITWERTIEDINTYECEGEIYKGTFEKEIAVVFESEIVNEELDNKVKGTVATYYPDNDPTKPSEEKTKLEAEDNALIETKYETEKTVIKVWDDNNNERGNRPEGLEAILTSNGEILETVVLSDKNNWQHKFEHLKKYDEQGNLVEYSITEKEINTDDLEYYEPAVIRVEKDTTTITNKYRRLTNKIDSTIQKDGTKELVGRETEVSYSIKYNATISDYIGEAKATVTDYLPYKIDVKKSDLAGGTYDEEAQTITWEQDLGHINTIRNGNFTVKIAKQIKVSYINLDTNAEKMTNKVKGKIELIPIGEKDEVQAEHDTILHLLGKVIVEYKEIDTNENIPYTDENGEEKLYNYDEQGYVGDNYTTKLKEIPYYEFVKVTDNKEGKFKKEDQTVIYYYKKLLFNIGVDKTVKEMTVNGEAKTIISNKLTKIEIPQSKLFTAEVLVKYRIVVKNTEKIDGKAQIIDTIPAGFELAETNPTYWEQLQGGKIQTSVELKVGEQKELEVVLKWKNLTQNLGVTKNIVEVASTENPAKFADINPDDNISTAEVIITVKTGVDVAGDILTIIGIIGLAVLLSAMYVDSKMNKGKK